MFIMSCVCIHYVRVSVVLCVPYVCVLCVVGACLLCSAQCKIYTVDSQMTQKTCEGHKINTWNHTLNNLIIYNIEPRNIIRTH